MKNYMVMMGIAAICCLVFSQEVRTQGVYSYSEVSYYQPTNSMYAVVQSMPDYSTELYYCLTVSGSVFKDGIEQAYVYGHNYTGGYSACSGWAVADTFLPYDPNAEYEIEANHEVEVLYRTFNESGYEDYYNFSEYIVGDQVYYPTAYDFTGGGPPISSSIKNILLGQTYSIFTEAATSGPPHHLKVVSDVIITTPACGGEKERKWKFRVVDLPGRNAGRIPIKENFPGPITDSCSQYPVPPTPCGRYAYPFTDTLTTGCPPGQPSPGGSCGFAINPVLWQWCPRGRPVVTLATLVYDVRFNSISINGQSTPYIAGTQFYP